ncbi:MAG: capsule assembly Wzi family protein [Muribaculaceae bacterium]|nr:capsule assembly Wzi family protein [Muribaculaceae bacterium]
MTKLLKLILATAAAACSIPGARAEYPVNYTTEVMVNAGNGTFAPYYIASNRHGVLTQAKGIMARAALWRNLDKNKRFSYDFGLDLYGGGTNNTVYAKWDATAGESNKGAWTTHPEHPANFWIQQAYASIKYRSLYLTAGIKDRSSYMLNPVLSSGDMVESGNARSVPQVRAGFIDFQDIPFTNHWLQIQGELAYGLYCQNKWLENHFDYYTGVYNRNMLFNYKRIYFRTNPSKPFSATFGAQGAGLFGGTSYHYKNGKLASVDKNATDLDAFWQALIPRISGVEGYVQGQHLGSWDIRLRYRLRNNAEIFGYVQNLWEDGSSMAKLNGWDGLWGLEYKAPQKGWLDGAVLEYLQTSNQSGPLHWDPADNQGTSLNIGQATGSDDYYNNGFYGPYANFGMAQGNPMLKSPIYYTDGGFRFHDTRVKAVHAGVTGTPYKGLSYRLLCSYRTSWGTYFLPYLEKKHSTSLLMEASYTPAKIPALNIKGELGIDHGELYGNVVGACLTVSYSGLLNIF